MVFKSLEWKKWGGIISVALLLVVSMSVVLADQAKAAEIVSGDPDAVIAEDVTIDDDLFISGERVVIEGIVKGDLFAIGTEVIVNGTIEGNAFIGGELLTIDGTVEGNVYSGGCALTLGPDAQIGRGIRAGGFSLIAERGSKVGRDIEAVVFQSMLNGEIGQNVEVATGAFEFGGSADGDVTLELGETCPVCIEFVPVEAIIPGLRIGEDAEIRGGFDYRITSGNFEEVDITNIELIPADMDIDQFRNDVVMFLVTQEIRRAVGEFITLLIVGGLLLYFLTGSIQSVMDKITDRPFPSIGWGLLIVLLFPLVLLLAVLMLVILIWIINFFTLGKLTGFMVGLSLVGIASFVTIFVFVLSLATKAVFGYLVGKALLKRFSPATLNSRWGTIWSLVIGVLLYEIVRMIPVLGWLAALIVILLGAGAIFRMMRDTLRSKAAVA